MNRNITVSLLMAVLMVAGAIMVLGACAEPDGAGQDNTIVTGARLLVTDIMPADGDQETYTIDVMQSVCSAGTTTTPPGLEDFYDAFYSAEFQVVNSGNVNKEAFTGLLITGYQVAYSISAGTPPPTIKVNTSIYVPYDESVNVSDLLLMPISGKNFIAPGVVAASGAYMTCTITFYAENDYGEEMEATYSVYILVNDYDNC